LEEAGGFTFISGVMDSSPSSSNGTYYASIVTEMYVQRQMLNLVVKLKNRLSNCTGMLMEEIVADFERGASEIRGLLTRPTGDVDKREALRELVDIYQHASDGKRPYLVPTGYPDLDKISGGMRPGELFVLGASTGKGKSTLAVNIAENCAAQGIPVGIFSLEMKGIELIARMVASVSRVNSRAAEEGVLNQAQLRQMVVATCKVDGFPIHIHDKSGVSIEEISVHAAKWVKEHGVKLVVIDHLHLVRKKGENAVQALGDISDKAKVMAMNLNIPVILVSQLNRSSEKEGRLPALHDLRESGAIEQAGNFVWLLFDDENNEKNKTTVVRLLQAKCRRGPKDTVSFFFNKQINRFESVERRVSDG